jgi:hypothetical protein
MSMVQLKCEICGCDFERRTAEVRRNQKLGRRTFCSLSCLGKVSLSNIPFSKRDNKQWLRADNKADEFSKFRWFLARAKQRKHIVDITLQDLKEQWEKQNGTCPYTGWVLKAMDGTNKTKQLPYTPDRASLDRIDSSKGYIKGNIQYVSMMAQFAKNKWADEQLVKFCKAVAENKSAALS